MDGEGGGIGGEGGSCGRFWIEDGSDDNRTLPVAAARVRVVDDVFEEEDEEVGPGGGALLQCRCWRLGRYRYLILGFEFWGLAGWGVARWCVGAWRVRDVSWCGSVCSAECCRWGDRV